MIERTISRQLIYNGRLIKLHVTTVKLPNGRITKREIIEHSPSVVIVPICDNGDIILISQYRSPVERELLELPAGGINPNETPVAAVERELCEETGLRPNYVKRIGGYYSSPGFTTEFLELYLAKDLVNSASNPDDDEIISVRRVNQKQIADLITSGQLCDAKSIAGLGIYFENYFS
jgi:ADP-ribose pyrophosphatase